MYTRYPNYRFGSKIRLPENYSGNAFASKESEELDASDTEDFVEDVAADTVSSDEPERKEAASEEVAVMGREEKRIKLPSFKLDVGKLFSGGFGFEELLIIALILLISSGDNDDDTILLLALLLFIR